MAKAGFTRTPDQTINKLKKLSCSNKTNARNPEQKVVYLKFILLSMLEYKYSKYTMDHVLVAY